MKGKRVWQVTRWHFAHALNRIKLRHVVSIGLFSFWLVTIVLIDHPLHIENQKFSAQVALDRAGKEESPKPFSGNEEKGDLVDGFIASLPAYASYPKQLRALQDLADKNGISIRQVDFRYEHLTGIQINKLTLHVDLTGDEVQQRKLMQIILNAFPNLSIAKLSLVTNFDPGGTVEQKLDVNFYYRSDKASG